MNRDKITNFYKNSALLSILYKKVWGPFWVLILICQALGMKFILWVMYIFQVCIPVYTKTVLNL